MRVPVRVCAHVRINSTRTRKLAHGLWATRVESVNGIAISLTQCFRQAIKSFWPELAFEIFDVYRNFGLRIDLS